MCVMKFSPYIFFYVHMYNAKIIVIIGGGTKCVRKEAGSRKRNTGSCGGNKKGMNVNYYESGVIYNSPVVPALHVPAVPAIPADPSTYAHVPYLHPLPPYPPPSSPELFIE